MSKRLKRFLLIIVGVLILGFVGRSIIRAMTKQHSPEETINFISEGVTFTIFYNRPYKKKRVIFGDLVPFGQVWRTGANEATTFTTNKDILVDGTTLKAGTYTLWTIPDKDSWKVIFNGDTYDWGISIIDGNPSRDPEYDALIIEVPILPLLTTVEQFSIYFEEANDFTIMYLAWDRTAIAIPLKV